MIVFLNIKDQCLDVYTEKGCHHCNFSETETIKQLIGKERVIYVTKAIETTKKDVLDIVGSLANSMTKKMLQQDGGKSYLRSTLKGYMQLSDLDTTFEGPAHFVPLDRIFEKYGKDIFQKNKTLNSLLKNGQLQILSESQMSKLANQHFEEQKKKQAAKDASLDSIIVDGKVEDFDLDGTEENSLYDAIEIDVKGGGSGGGSTNEGTLLPDDF